jgi:hypothetical protein
MNDSKTSEQERCEVTVTGWLRSHQVKQHLQAQGVPYREDKGKWGSMFTFDATPEQWESIGQWVEKVKQ